jgi:hypothetical protein
MDGCKTRNGTLIDGKMFLDVCVLNVWYCPCQERWDKDFQVVVLEELEFHGVNRYAFVLVTIMY